MVKGWGQRNGQGVGSEGRDEMVKGWGQMGEVKWSRDGVTGEHVGHDSHSM